MVVGIVTWQDVCEYDNQKKNHLIILEIRSVQIQENKSWNKILNDRRKIYKVNTFFG